MVVVVLADGVVSHCSNMTNPSQLNSQPNRVIYQLYHYQFCFTPDLMSINYSDDYDDDNDDNDKDQENGDWDDDDNKDCTADEEL